MGLARRVGEMGGRMRGECDDGDVVVVVRGLID